MYAQGEMSATIMRYASEWARLVPGLRQRIKGSVAADSVQVKMGIGLNFNRLDDTTSVQKQWGSSRMSWLAWQVGLETPGGTQEGGAAPPIDTEGLGRLFGEELQFVAISAYAPYNLAGNSLSVNEFENSAFIFCTEMLDSYGIDVKGLARSGQLEFHFSEFGIGGGKNYAGNQVRVSDAVG